MPITIEAIGGLQMAWTWEKLAARLTFLSRDPLIKKKNVEIKVDGKVYTGDNLSVTPGDGSITIELKSNHKPTNPERPGLGIGRPRGRKKAVATEPAQESTLPT